MAVGTGEFMGSDQSMVILLSHSYETPARNHALVGDEATYVRGNTRIQWERLI